MPITAVCCDSGFRTCPELVSFIPLYQRTDLRKNTSNGVKNAEPLLQELYDGVKKRERRKGQRHKVFEKALMQRNVAVRSSLSKSIVHASQPCKRQIEFSK